MNPQSEYLTSYEELTFAKQLAKAGWVVPSNKESRDIYEQMSWQRRAKKKLGDNFWKDCEAWANKRFGKERDSWGGWYYRWCQGEYEVIGAPRDTPQRRMRDIIRSRIAPIAFVENKRKFLPPTDDIRELRARETMRRVLGEEEFRRFLRHGFVCIQGKSGLRYQIFPGHGVTAVFDGREMVERLCVVLRGNFCPTDSLMMRYLMILNDEAQFRSFAIKHSLPQKLPQVDLDTPLTELFRGLKGVA